MGNAFNANLNGNGYPNHHPNGHRLYSTSNSNSNYRNSSAAASRPQRSLHSATKSPRSVSYGNVMQSKSKLNNSFVPPPQIQFVMPSERKQLSEKEKKKIDKKKAHKIKQSVGAFFHSFKSKKNPKYSKEELSKIAK